MKVVYTYTEGTEPIYINGSNGVQRVLIVFKDNDRTFVYFCDDYHREVYLNEIISTRLSIGFDLSNFKRIENDSEFYSYLSFIENNYNYNGKHINEKIDGHDLGGPVIV